MLYTLDSRLYVVHMLYVFVFCFVQGPRSCRVLSILCVSVEFTVCVFADSCCCVVYLETVLIAVAPSNNNAHACLLYSEFAANKSVGPR